MRKKVLVAMSGGVDSSTAAFLLKEQGYEVVGVSLDLYDFSGVIENRAGTCCSLDDIYDARKVCFTLGISHYVFNFRDIFEESVIENFVREYASGRTPNPCVICNEEVKFNYLLDRAIALGFDYVATGHYARIEKRGGVYRLLKGVDSRKDQSYFLYMLNQKTLPNILFPCGEYRKSEVREIADRAGLPVRQKKESQEICFITENSYRDFLMRRGITTGKGEIVSVHGEVLGHHEGVFNFTIGQRKGLGISAGIPLYVVDLDPSKNRVIVGPEEFLYAEGAYVAKLSFVSGEPPMDVFEAKAKVRYRSPEVDCVIQVKESSGLVVFRQRVKSVTPGQYLVLYNGEEVIGGGVISEVIREMDEKEVM